jgi:hypothetical protein
MYISFHVASGRMPWALLMKVRIGLKARTGENPGAKKGETGWSPSKEEDLLFHKDWRGQVSLLNVSFASAAPPLASPALSLALSTKASSTCGTGRRGSVAAVLASIASSTI